MAFNIISFIFGTHTDTLDMPVDFFEVGYTVSVMASEYPDTALKYGERVGVIESIGPSPYYGEAGVERAYVVGDGFTDYVLLTDLLHFSFA